MKKVYVRPLIEIIEMEVEDELLTLSVVDDIPADPDEEVLANKRRGEWGDLWVETPLEEEDDGRWRIK